MRVFETFTLMLAPLGAHPASPGEVSRPTWGMTLSRATDLLPGGKVTSGTVGAHYTIQVLVETVGATVFYAFERDSLQMVGFAFQSAWGDSPRSIEKPPALTDEEAEKVYRGVQGALTGLYGPGVHNDIWNEQRTAIVGRAGFWMIDGARTGLVLNRSVKAGTPTTVTLGFMDNVKLQAKAADSH